MKKGLTFIEVIISISFVSILTLILTLMIINIKENISIGVNIKDKEVKISEFERNFEILISQYDNQNWYFYKDSIIVNEKLILKVNRENYEFYFLDNIMKEVPILKESYLIFVNSNLLKYETVLNNVVYYRFFYIGGKVYEC